MVKWLPVHSWNEDIAGRAEWNQIQHWYAGRDPAAGGDGWRWILSRNGSVSKPCTPVVHIKIAGKWMFIPLKMVLIGIDPYPNGMSQLTSNSHPTTSVLDTCMGWHGSLDICGHVHPSCRVVLGQPGLATLSQFSHVFLPERVMPTNNTNPKNTYMQYQR